MTGTDFPASALLVYTLIAKPGGENPAAQLNMVVNVQRKRAGFLHPVAGIARKARVVQFQGAMHLGIGAVALQPVLFIFVQAQANIHVMCCTACHKPQTQAHLNSSGEVFAVIGAKLYAARRRIQGAAEDFCQLPAAETAEAVAEIDCLNNAGPAAAFKGLCILAAVKIHALGFEPVPCVVIVVGRYGERHLVCDVQFPAGNQLFMLCLDSVQVAEAVAAIGIALKICICQPQVALPGVLVSILPLEFQPLAAALRGISQLGCVVHQMQACLAARIQLVKAV